MATLKSTAKIFLFIFCIYLLLCYGTLFREGVTNGLILSVSVVIPSLFTFIVFSTFIVNTNFFAMLKKAVPSFFAGIFKMSKSEFLSFFISLIGGYPSGAKLLFEMGENGEITKMRAAELLPFFISAGPAFIITGIGLSFYNSSVIGFILFSSHTIASLILPILMLKKGESKRHHTIKSSSAVDRFVSSVSSCSSAVITMTGFIIFFGAILNTAHHLLNLNTESYALISLFLEITSGASFVSQNLPLNLALISISAGLSFSSASILMQAKFLCGNLKICLAKLIIVRLLHAVISSSICYLLLSITPIPSEVFSNIGKTAPSITSLSFASAVMFILLMLTTVMKVEKNTGKNR